MLWIFFFKKLNKLVFFHKLGNLKQLWIDFFTSLKKLLHVLKLSFKLCKYAEVSNNFTLN